MVAVLFITIGFFGYVALHARLLHSGQRLEEKEVVRAATDFYEALEVGRVMSGSRNSINGAAHQEDSALENFYRISSSTKDTNTSWKLNYPPEFHPGMESTMELSPGVYREPYVYTWEKR